MVECEREGEGKAKSRHGERVSVYFDKAIAIHDNLINRTNCS